MNNQVFSFLAKHNFVQHVDVYSASLAILDDMNNGLLKKKNAFQDMIKTYSNPPKNKNNINNQNVIVIDAGGTNFRSCLVNFDSNGNAQISELQKTKMPGTEKELNKKDFFEQFAKNLEHLKNKAERIGFCFSYPMEIQEDGDGVLLGFSKEVKAPEVIGSKIGQCLKEVLIEHGWTSIKKITLLNDTVAALLAGAACSKQGENYSSYIGFILGTGLNAAYVQPEIKDILTQQIIVCESGKFLNVVRSDFDLAFDKIATNPGSFYLEKLCSGAYLGSISLFALQTACKEELLSKEVCDKILTLKELSLIEVNQFLHTPYNNDCVLGKIINNSKNQNDVNIIFEILDAIVERSARYSAAILIACAIQTNKGKEPSKPICILCNGTTFFKTYKIKQRVFGYLEEVLSKQLGIYWNVISCENDITLGSAISGLID